MEGTILPVEFSGIVRNLVELGKAFNDRPAQWCRSLMASNELEALLGLEASVKPTLGLEVQKLLRVCEIVRDSQLPPERKPNVFTAETWDSKALLKSGLMMFLDVVHDDSSVLRGLDQAKSELEKKLRDTITHAVTELEKAKKLTATVYQQLSQIMDAAFSKDFVTHSELVAQVNSNENDQALENTVQGAGFLILILVLFLCAYEMKH